MMLLDASRSDPHCYPLWARLADLAVCTVDENGQTD
jgi:hypothetical protein